MKKKKEFMYQYPSDAESLFVKLNEKDDVYHRYLDGQYLIEIKNDSTFFLGVERGAHNGYFYVGHVQESDKKTLIYGSIVYAPDENGNEKAWSKKERFFFIAACIIGFPIVLLVLVLVTIIFAGSYFYKIIFKKNKSVEKAKEEKLDDFMIKYLQCKKIKKEEMELMHAQMLIKEIIDECKNRLEEDINLKNKGVIESILKEFMEMYNEIVTTRQIRLVCKNRPLQSSWVIIDSADFSQDNDLFDKVYAFEKCLKNISNKKIIYQYN